MPRKKPPTLRIVSGGQTGVDRGALDAALAAGAPCGGWCPAGRLAEDGAVPARYPLRELPGAGYAERTRQNVLDSDGTLVLHGGVLQGGTAQTARGCDRAGKPCLVIDARTTPPEEAARLARAFVRAHRIRVLNVAGPRASQWANGGRCARAVVGGLLEWSCARRVAPKRSRRAPPKSRAA